MKNIIRTMKETKITATISASICTACMIIGFIVFGSSVVSAQNTNTLDTPSGLADPTQSSFKIVVCDGPELPPSLKASAKPGYVPCNFNGAMMQVQHLINVAMVLGVFAAIILFTYAGYLLMTGKEGDRSKAKDIFPKILWGFVIMLSSWFIVYQILNWLTGASSFTKLLGNP